MSRSNAGAADHINATVPATCGEAIDVPVNAAYPPGTDERTATAGAEMFGLIRFGSHADGPRPELTYTLPLMSNPPAAYDSGRLPGLDACPHAGPGFPEANCGKIPAATHACTVDRYHGSVSAPPPQELFTTCGRISGFSFSPCRSVGARLNWPGDSRQ